MGIAGWGRFGNCSSYRLILRYAWVHLPEYYVADSLSHVSNFMDSPNLTIVWPGLLPPSVSCKGWAYIPLQLKKARQYCSPLSAFVLVAVGMHGTVSVSGSTKHSTCVVLITNRIFSDQMKPMPGKVAYKNDRASPYNVTRAFACHN